MLNLVPSFKCLSIEHIEDFLVVDLEKRAVNVDSFGASGSLSLRKDFSNSSDRQANIIYLGHLHFASPFLAFLLFVLIAFHCVCLAWACLSVGKDCRMESLDHFSNQTADLELLENLLLSVLFINDFVEFVILSGIACSIFPSRLTFVNSKIKVKLEVKG